MSAKISFCDQLGPRSFLPLLLLVPDATVAVGAMVASLGLMGMLRPVPKGRRGWKQGKGIVPAHIQHGSGYFGRQYVDIHDGEVVNLNCRKKKFRIFSHSSIGVCLLCVQVKCGESEKKMENWMSTFRRSKSNRGRSSVCQSSEFELLENESLQVLFFLFVPTCTKDINTRNSVYILKRNMCTMNGCWTVSFGMLRYKKALTIH